MAIDVTNLYERRADNRWDRTCVSDIVERLTWSTPEREAITGWDGAFSEPRFARLSFGELDALTSQVAHGLLVRGLRRGDCVAMICENSVEGYAFKLGVAKAGLVVAPMNPAMAPDVVQHLFEQVEPKLTVVDAELWPRVEGVFDSLGRRPDVTIEIGGQAVAGSVSFGEFVDAQPVTEPDGVVVHGDDIWEILFTSGTTAMPKGVMQSHSSVTLSAHGFALTLTRGLELERDLRVAAFLPMMYHVGHHIFALSAFVAGGSLVLGRRPDPAQVAAAIEHEAVTALWAGSPAMLGAVLQAVEGGGVDASSLTVAVYGWAALSPSVLAGLKRHAPRVTAVAIFGQTESISCHRFWPDLWSELYEATAPEHNYVGLPSPLLASRIVDQEGASLEGLPGVAGEAVYRSPVMASGYYKDEVATREAFRGGWFHSGDSCLYDNDGLRVMVDRYKDIVKSGGENVSTLRVESVLTQHPGVVKCAVIGRLDERWGELVTAVVVPDPGVPVTSDELIAWSRQRLAGFETPKQVLFVEALPETVGGKVMKYKLREQYR